jgi:hypothetical protein
MTTAAAVSHVPTVDDLAADVITHHFDDMIAPAGLTNMHGTVVVGHDLTGIRGVTFPPVSQGGALTGALFVDGRLFESFGVPVAHAWRPDRVQRRATVGDLSIQTTTVCVPGEAAVAIDIVVSAAGSERRQVTLGLSLGARVTRKAGAWDAAEMPDAVNSVHLDQARNRIAFTDDATGAWSVQGVDAAATVRGSGVAPASEEFSIGVGGMGRGGDVTVTLEVPAGGSVRVGYVHAVGSDRAETEAVFDRVAADVPAAVASAERFWNEQLAAMFGGTDEYAGRLPVLETTSPALRKLYWWGALGVIWFRREWPGNVLGRTYDTLMPNYWGTNTFIWDYSLSSVVHAMLDPVEMKNQLRAWISSDIHTMFATSAVDGSPIGRWYSVNDFAMTRLVTDYVRFTGDDAFLDEKVAAGDGESLTVCDHLVVWAEAWRSLRRGGTLADYGEIDNLLECVSSYTHEVASLNAANVWCLRTVAEIVEGRGDDATAARLRGEADELLRAVLDLYIDGTGYFAAGQPDGTRLPVRHCYDFSIVGTAIAGDLPEGVRREMVDFFRRELQTENWMRALSPWDPDASYSVRPDHQWNGAYPAWPADAGRALAALGAPEVAAEWIEGLARSTNQGPTGQAHFVEEAIPGINGGARKAPPQLPYINDWACSSSGAWVQFVIEGLFGLNAPAGVDPVASGALASIDPDAVLRGVLLRGAPFDVHADGRVVASRS